VNPRIDCIIVKYDIATNAITIERLAGAEAPSPTAPALTQIDGNTWEVALAQVYITTGGVITRTNERRWAVPLGVHMAGDIVAKKCTLGGTANKHPIDVDLGSADEDWSLCDGGTYNGYVTDDLRDRMIIGAGSTYVAGTGYGSATIDISHVHAQTVHNHAQTVHAHGMNNHVHGMNNHVHVIQYTTWTADYGGYTVYVGNASVGNPGVTNAATGNTAAATGNTADSAAVNTGNSAAANTGTWGSAAKDVLNPCFARAWFMYCPAI
jgi:hypothetical protein